VLSSHWTYLLLTHFEDFMAFTLRTHMLVIYKSAHGIQSGEFDLTSSPPIAQSAFYAALLVRDIHQWYISEVDFSDFSLGSHLKLGTSLNSPPAMARRTTSATRCSCCRHCALSSFPTSWSSATLPRPFPPCQVIRNIQGHLQDQRVQNSITSRMKAP